MKGSYINKFFVFLILCFLPIFLYSGLQIISDFDTIDDINWGITYTDYGATAEQNLITSDKFEGNACIEFNGSNLTNWNNARWQWTIPPPAANWSNYTRLIFAMKIINVYQNAPDPNDSLNFGFTIKEPWGDPNWKGEVWNYYITNRGLSSNVWYLWETNITKSNAKNWNQRFNEWQDEDPPYDGDSNGNMLPPRGVRQIEYFNSTENSLLIDQKIRLDFMAIMSTPQPAIENVTNDYPIELSWTDMAPNHPLFNVLIYTNTTNSSPVGSAIVEDAETTFFDSFNANDCNLKPYHRYLWRIRSGYVVTPSANFNKFTVDKNMVLNISSTTLWSGLSDAAYFTNNGIKPFSPALFSPADNSSNYAVNDLTFTWENLKEEGAEVYAFAVSSNQGFTKIITSVTLNATNSTVSSVSNHFEIGSNYYYYVGSGYTNYSGALVWDKTTTNVFNFSYIAPVITVPVDNGTVTTSPYIFQWVNAFEGVTYELQIAEQLSFSTILTSVSGVHLSCADITFSSEKFEGAGPFYCRVKATGPLGDKCSPINIFYLALSEETPPGEQTNVIAKTIAFPTRLTKDASVTVLIKTDTGKVLNKVKIVFLDPFHKVMSIKKYTSTEIGADNKINIPLTGVGLKKGFYFIYTILYYNDNSINKSDPSPIIIR